MVDRDRLQKPRLTVERLTGGGFREVGCWELSPTRDLAHRIELPKLAGVYAFAIDDVVQYVGLASKSVAQRLGFYRKPGASQRTNVRLNEVIRTHLGEGCAVRILIAHPTDSQWNGFALKGAEGLEAGLIADFDLPWNMRGNTAPAIQKPSVRSGKLRAHAVGQILELVRMRPGMTELEIAKALYGPAAVQQQVNQHCRALLRQGRIKRAGLGGQADPFTYRAS